MPLSLFVRTPRAPERMDEIEAVAPSGAGTCRDASRRQGLDRANERRFQFVRLSGVSDVFRLKTTGSTSRPWASATRSTTGLLTS